ncbi:hypothetical protein SAMN06265337_3727 [Hymenobacter gelipurpurascens]|uniref:Outer membrane protein beta-barrel domain-containing protein n=1 Tax=Hymenobacter gelipurpurascens TaxID=89968 RepID=A0A212UG46_9BACT|nr:hypothetical protein [Hymenobacter gelipurpurascens]SNC77150.1 hypothetical protein SAMN06265337_3727 [Hymenobacter gelipurpurascens]
MKKLVVTFLSLRVIVHACDAQAQIPTGTKLLGGSFSYNSNKLSTTDPNFPASQQTYESKTRNFNINPSAGIFVANNLAAGITAGFSSSKSTYPYYDGNSLDKFTQVGRANTVYAAPFLRYYYLPTEAFGLYGQLSAGYSHEWNTTDFSSANRLSTKNTGYSVYTYLTPALVFFPVAKLGLELTFGGIGYNRSTANNDNSPSTQPGRKETRSSFGANFSFNNLALGASYYLGR